MGQAPDAQSLLKLLNEALETADFLDLKMIGAHIDHARALVVDYLVKGQQADLGSTSA